MKSACLSDNSLHCSVPSQASAEGAFHRLCDAYEHVSHHGHSCQLGSILFLLKEKPQETVGDCGEKENFSVCSDQYVYACALCCAEGRS